MTSSRPWLKGTSAEGLREGDRIDILWGDGFTSAHDFALRKGVPGVVLNYHDTHVWVPLKDIQHRKIPLNKRRPPADIVPRRRTNLGS